MSLYTGSRPMKQFVVHLNGITVNETLSVAFILLVSCCSALVFLLSSFCWEVLKLVEPFWWNANTKRRRAMRDRWTQSDTNEGREQRREGNTDSHMKIQLFSGKQFLLQLCKKQWMDTLKMLTHGKENKVETDHFLVWTSPQKIHTNPNFFKIRRNAVSTNYGESNS